MKRLIAMAAGLGCLGVLCGASAAAQQAQGPNPRFYEVQQHLDPGGSFYLYGDVKDMLHNVMQDIQKEAQANNLPQVVSIFQVAERELDRLGLLGIEDFGMSVMPEGNGLYRYKSFTGVRDGRKGILALFGGAPHPFEGPQMAPSDTLMLLDFDLDTAQALTLTRQIATDIGGAVANGLIDQGFAKFQANTGIDPNAVIASTKGHIVAFGTLDASPELKIPTASGEISMQRPQIAVAIEVSSSTLYTGLHQFCQRMNAAGEETVSGQTRMFTIQTPGQTPWPASPSIAYNGRYVTFASDRAYLVRALATPSGSDTLAADPVYQSLMAGLPTEGNRLVYVSPRVTQFTQELSQKMTASAMAQGGPAMQQMMAMQRFIQALQPHDVRAAQVGVNLPDGFLKVARSTESGEQMLKSLAVIPAAIISAQQVAMTAAQQTTLTINDSRRAPAGTRAKVARAQSDMRSLATAIESYYIDNNSYPAWSADPDRNAFGERGKTDAVLSGQPTFRTDYGVSHVMSLTSPISYVTSADRGDPFGQTMRPPSYWTPPSGNGWIEWAPGPDGVYDIRIDKIQSLYDPTGTVPSPALLNLTYDPTNGSTSAGDVWRTKQ